VSTPPLPASFADPGEQLDRVATGFGFTEGPAWRDEGGSLVFSDIPGDTLHRFDPTGAVSVYRRPSRKGNGNTFDAEGRLLTCQHAASRLVREEGDELVVLADSFEGRELNSPNDVVVAVDGSVYFTDPIYGRRDYFGVPRQAELEFRGLYRVTADGELELLARDFGQPNGLCFSPDGTVLYVNDTERRHIRVYALGADGSLSGGEVFAELTGDEPGVPDGMKVDAGGNVWCSGPGGIHVFDTATRLIGVLRVPEPVGNFAWGGATRHDLYICATTSLYRLRTRIAGHRPH
jgi:gluconolactonase